RDAARAAAALREPPVSRGRRPALVASAAGARRAHAHLRRLPLAAARARPLCRGDRRPRRPRGDGTVPAGPSAATPRRVVLRPRGTLARVVYALRARAARARPRFALRRPRPATD